MNSSMLVMGVATAITSFVMGLEAPEFGGTNSAGSNVKETATHVRTQRVGNPPQGIDHSTSPAMASVVDLELIPKVEQSADGTQALDLALSVNNHSNSDLTLVYSLEVQDDEGRIFVSPVPAGTTLSFAASAVQPKEIQGVPTGLPDGFYVVHLLAAWRRAEAKEVGSSYLFLHVLNNKANVVTGDDWISKSNIMVGQPEAAFESEGK